MRCGPASQNSLRKGSSALPGVIIMRWVLMASSLLTRAKKALAMAFSWARQGTFQFLGEQVQRQHLVALGLHGGEEQGFLVAKMAVDGQLGNTGFGGDLIHADPVEAFLGEQQFGRFQDRSALAQVFGTTGAGDLGGRGVTGLGGGVAGHNSIVD